MKNYIAVRGKGNPNEEGGAYQQAISVLYAVAYTLKMSYKTDYKIKNLFSWIKCGIIEIMKAEYKRTNYPSDLSDEEWEKIMKFLVKETRIKSNRTAELHYALIDSQSVKTVYNSEKRGFDGGKKRKDERGT